MDALPGDRSVELAYRRLRDAVERCDGVVSSRALEQRPHSSSCRAALCSELERSRAQSNPAILKMARELISCVRARSVDGVWRPLAARRSGSGSAAQSAVESPCRVDSGTVPEPIGPATYPAQRPATREFGRESGIDAEDVPVRRSSASRAAVTIRHRAPVSRSRHALHAGASGALEHSARASSLPSVGRAGQFQVRSTAPVPPHFTAPPPPVRVRGRSSHPGPRRPAAATVGRVRGGPSRGRGWEVEYEPAQLDPGYVYRHSGEHLGQPDELMAEPATSRTFELWVQAVRPLSQALARAAVAGLVVAAGLGGVWLIFDLGSKIMDIGRGHSSAPVVAVSSPAGPELAELDEARSRALMAAAEERRSWASGAHGPAGDGAESFAAPKADVAPDPVHGAAVEAVAVPDRLAPSIPALVQHEAPHPPREPNSEPDSDTRAAPLAHRQTEPERPTSGSVAEPSSDARVPGVARPRALAVASLDPLPRARTRAPKASAVRRPDDPLSETDAVGGGQASPEGRPEQTRESGMTNGSPSPSRELPDARPWDQAKPPTIVGAETVGPFHQPESQPVDSSLGNAVLEPPAVADPYAASFPPHHAVCLPEGAGVALE